MAFRLSTGFRNLQLGTNLEAISNGTFTTDTTGWTASANMTATGGVTHDGVTGCVSLKDSTGAGYIYQEVTVIPGHTYKLTWSGRKTGTTDDAYVTIGTSAAGAEEVYGSADFTAATISTAMEAAWTDFGDATDDTNAANEEDAAIIFTAGASTTSVFVNLEVSGATDTCYFDDVSLIDLGTSLGEIFRGGEIKIYTGSQPTSPDDAASGSLLVTIKNGGSTGVTWETAASGSVAKATAETWNGVCGTDGTAGWARIVQPDDPATDSTTWPRIDLACGTSGAQLNFSTTYFQNGSTQTITAFSISIPQG